MNRVLRRVLRALNFLAALGLTTGIGINVRAQNPCGASGNPITCENSLPGNPATEWGIAGSGDPSIQGFTTEFSVSRGEQLHFKVDTDATAWRLDVYRLGYYDGDGARYIASVNPIPAASYTQPPCTYDPNLGLTDCGNWSNSAVWTVPTNLVSGLFLARAVRLDNGGASHIPFVVRNDSSESDVLVRTSDSTWQAYNSFGGSSLYTGGPVGRAFKVSYNRPMALRGTEFARANLLATDYPFIRWIESNGYDVSYVSCADVARRPNELLEHKIIVSQGHDEYWSLEERNAFLNARNAGVHLAFFSGNTMFWKTRWESSAVDGGRPYRTLTCYKETHANAKIDPLPNVWTGTWRDPRFSPPADGGLPENQLMGTIFTANCCRFDGMQVSSEEGKRRLWRHTSLSTLPANTTAMVGAGSVGYEWNEDLDNGFRPPGTFRLSSNTVSMSTYLLDHGSTYGFGTATHSLTMYKHTSGARVFSAGTIHFAWALDSEHDTPDNVLVSVDPRVQQAVVNLFADMQVFSSFLQPGMVAATATTDTQAPSAAITFPSNGASFPANQVLNITGTATDAGGGVIGGVEVTVNGGATWHPATGGANWSYSWTPTSTGSATLRARAVDDSGNLGNQSSARTITITSPQCPCNLLGTATPAVAASTDSGAVELGLKIEAVAPAVVTGVRFYKGPGNSGTHRGNLWSSSGTQLATVVFTNETASGWQSMSFPSPVTLTVGQTYVISYHAPNGRYAFDLDYFATSGVGTTPIRALSDSAGGGNGVYTYSTTSTWPVESYRAANYWVDVIYDTNVAPDTTRPTVTSRSPGPGATGVDPNTNVTATFSELLNASTVNTSTFTLRDASNNLVASAVTFNGSTLVATLNPTPTLQANSTYTARVRGGSSGVKDIAGNSLASDVSWTFTTGEPITQLTIWSPSTIPGVADSNDAFAYELGLKFRSSVAGRVLGVRFYKSAANTGTHVGKLWTEGGTQLASVTFSGETASGWQQALFSSPVNVQANTLYIVSYYAPNGRYSVNLDYFATSSVTSGVLTAVANTESPNGVYKVSPSGFPSSMYRAANYWVDVVFDPTSVPDTTPPAITARSPAANAVDVDPGADVTVSFSEPVESGTISSSTVSLRDASSSLVPATVTYDSGSQTATLNPAATLEAHSTYTATVTGGSAGVKDLAGNALAANSSWSFTTGAVVTRVSIWSPSTTPGVIDSNDPTSYELGLKFRSAVAGRVLGVRYYKSPANSGTHIGRLWTAGGVELGAVTFTGETGSGWQEALFASPISIQANTIYVISYFTPTGRYSVNLDYFASGGVTSGVLTAVGNSESTNGVYKVSPSGFPTSSFRAANYWVDVVFDPTSVPDTTPPTITSVSPAANAVEVDVNADVTAVFNEAIDVATVTASTVTLRNSGGTLITAGVAYNSLTQTVTLNPAGALAANSVFTATILGGAGGIKDLAGNLLAADAVWSFTTGAAVTTQTIWSPSTVPGTVDSFDSSAYELGVKFRAAASGTVRGVRFYKSTANTGTHVGHLWTSTGTLLGTVTFTNETASGWQQALFSSPIPISANTLYVVSYHVPQGRYSVNLDYFAGEATTSGFLTAVAAAESINGVYKAGAPGFPNLSYRSANYWVDLVFELAP